MIKFVSDLWFSPVSSTSKTESHDIAEILLKVALNTIKQTNVLFMFDKIYALFFFCMIINIFEEIQIKLMY